MSTPAPPAPLSVAIPRRSFAAAPPRVRRAQILSLSLLILSGVVNYMDRGTLAVASQTVAKELGLSLGQMGLLLSAFSWSYALAQLPTGGLVDRVGPRRLLAVGLALWSVAQAAGGLAANFVQLITARVFLGIGEAPQFPSAARVVSNWYPVSRRGVPTGIFNSASPLGTALAPLILTQLIIFLDWRWMFILMGGAGLVVALVWYALYRDPAEMRLDQEETAYLTSETEERTAPKVTFADWLSLFSFRTTWGMILGFFGSVYLNWVYLSWLPAYLIGERHMSLARTGVAASVPFFCGFLGCLAAGWVSDQVTRRTQGSPVKGRRIPVVVAMLGMAAFTIPAALADSNLVALACISVVIFLANAASACSWALVTAAAPPSRIASLGALQNFGGFIGGALAPIVTGFIAQSFSFVPALLTGAAISFAGAMSYLFLVTRPIPEHAE
ncbi:MFS transporter [Telmatospirillum siberiense]|uniref:MFS transporter n=1 Tax=Telmatospirillum siberiense TaxID=382514 RepID=A0A2N3PQX9_9PROT|nr:MFS transporter [Telmatospirillum siberiense]PKU22809.1 MFS transporter [Telmatospirillum siberiense]